MSTVLVVAPAVVASWPAISAAVTAAIGTMGYSLAKEGHHAATNSQLSIKSDGKNRAEIEVDNAEILGESTGSEQEILVQRDGISARFQRDVRGALKVCVEGDGYSKAQLKQIGEELIGSVTQQYAYHRIMTEMRDRNMTVVHEEVDEDRTVRIRVRNS